MEGCTSSGAEVNKLMSDEERRELAAKLDKELDDFINSLERRPYADGWPEDKWEEEMEKHPFFMSKSPGDNQEVSPLIEGLQQLKYDENENTPLELAISYKEDGNFNFKCKKYRMAVISYTEGILKKCGDSLIESQLYSNRAAAHFHLGNYRSSLNDCYKAIKIDEQNMKARKKAIECCIKLKKFEEAINFCDFILEKCPTDSFTLKNRTEVLTLQKLEEKSLRKNNLENKKQKMELNKLKLAMEERRIRLELKENFFDSLTNSSEKPILQGNDLCWPVLFLYPEHSVSDFVEQFNESTTFLEQLEYVFASIPEWDSDGKYKAQVLSVYFEVAEENAIHSVDPKATLKSVLTSGRYPVRTWTISFFVLVKGSPAERRFLTGYDRKLDF